MNFNEIKLIAKLHSYANSADTIEINSAVCICVHRSPIVNVDYNIIISNKLFL